MYDAIAKIAQEILDGGDYDDVPAYQAPDAPALVKLMAKGLCREQAKKEIFRPRDNTPPDALFSTGTYTISRSAPPLPID